MKTYKSLCELLGYAEKNQVNQPEGNSKNTVETFDRGIISYAQNFEDVMLYRALGHVKNGFYIDVGAQDPVIDSVSKAFYDKGWRGIHVEAAPHYSQLLREARSDEIVLEYALSDVQGDIEFFIISDGGLSTGDSAIAKTHQENGFTICKISVQCMKLTDVLTLANGTEIHWLKIDVEGMEKSVLNGWSESEDKPWIVVVESTLPLTQIESHEQWEYLLLERGYQCCYFDGLNRYYVSEQHPELVKSFRFGPNVFDGFSLSGTASAPFCNLINKKLKQQELEIIDHKQHAGNNLGK